MALVPPSLCLLLLLLLAASSHCSARAQFNLFPNTWNSRTANQGRSDDSNRRQASRCFTLLDIATHGSNDCPRDFNHQYFDTHSCQFVCFSEVNQESSMFDQNGVAGGDKPRRGLP